MSKRDIEFIKATRVHIAEIARILNLSRQYVARVVKGEKDFLTDNYLARLMLFWKKDPIQFEIAKRAIEKYFPEYSGVVLGFIQGTITKNELPINEDCKNISYWMITANLIDILSNEQIFSSLKEITENGCELRFIIPHNDQIELIKNIFTENIDKVKAVVCPIKNINLIYIPSVLLKIYHNKNEVQMFGVSEEGFVPLSAQEGKRIRLLFTQIIQQCDIETLEEDSEAA